MLYTVKKQAILFLILILLTALCNCCNSGPDPWHRKSDKKHDLSYGPFRQRWWNFYRRGLIFSEQGLWARAAEDFHKALMKRNRDQRRARTYGMHLIDYFPHRELGVAYYHLNMFSKAETELLESLCGVQTAKAKFYLNITRKAILKRDGKDTLPPSIKILSPPQGLLTNRHQVRVCGVAEDDSGVETIVINNEGEFIELASERISFSRPVPLREGLNIISVKASDLSGRVTGKTLKITADFEGPVINFKDIPDSRDIKDQDIILKGIIADPSGIKGLRIAHRRFKYAYVKQAEFSLRTALKPGKNIITFSASDTAGNTTRGQITLFHNSHNSNKGYASAHQVRMAFSGSGILDTGQHRCFAISEEEPLKPALRLSLRDLDSEQTVYYDSIYIDGSVSSTTSVESVKINNQPVFIIPGKTIYFNRFLKLQEGENRIEIKARNSAGCHITKVIKIVRRRPAVHQAGSRMSIALLPFTEKGNPGIMTRVLQDHLLSSFIKQKRFNIVSRGPGFDAVLKELKLSGTQLVNRQTALRLGRMVSAEAILTGSVRETENSIEIYASLVDTETSSILDAYDVYGQGKSLALLHYLTNGLALKFKNAFPLIEGTVIKTSGSMVYADFGRREHIRKNMRFIVFREGTPIIHPVTGKILGSDTQQLGVARIVKVFEDYSVGRLEDSSGNKAVRLKDLVITR